METIKNLNLLKERLLANYKKKNTPFFVNVSGASGSGKTTISKDISNIFKDNSTVFSMDNYMRGQKFVDEILKKNTCSYGWDDIRVFDLQMVSDHLYKIQNNESVSQPIFDRKRSERSEHEFNFINPNDLIIIDGIHSLHPLVGKFADISIIVECSLHDRLWRRAVRNLCDNRYGAKSLDKIITNYLFKVEPSFKEYEADYLKVADISFVNHEINFDFKHIRPQISEYICYSEIFSLSPFPEVGEKNVLENIRVFSSLNNKYLLYYFKGIPLIGQQISQVCFELLQNYYFFKKIQ
ncbi:MAG: AAA family ATPase [Patescibacteria group bacterium]|nr:AAA family ATPase [Patescibacteria group bacterium]